MRKAAHDYRRHLMQSAAMARHTIFYGDVQSAAMRRSSTDRRRRCRRSDEEERRDDGPLIVQSDKDGAVGSRPWTGRHAPSSRRSPSWNVRPNMSTYRITPLALWNARAAGHDASKSSTLVSYSAAVPQPLLVDIVDTAARYGRLQLVKNPAHGRRW